MKWLMVALGEVVRNETAQLLIVAAALGLLLGVLIGGWGGVLG